MRVPPISEQRRIVDTLEDHISLLEAGDALLRVAGQRLRALWQSVLDAAHRGVLVAKRESGQSWRSMAAGDIGQVQGGIQKQPRRRPAANPFPFLRVANVTRAGLNLSEVHEIELFDGEPDRYLLKAGDLLVVEGNGSADQIGRAAMWHGDITRARTRIT